MAISFDGPTKVISLSTGTTSLSVQFLWSEWVRWVATSDNSKYLPAFSLLGGEAIDLTQGSFIPFYVFCLNGWRLRPQEDNHTLKVTEGILLVEGGGDPFLDTLGGYTVRVNYSQPMQAISVGAIPQNGQDVALAVWGYTGAGATTAEAKLGTAASGHAVTQQMITDLPAAIRTELATELAGIPSQAATQQQINMIIAMYELMGLDPTKPLTVTKTARTAGAILQSIATSATETVVTRV
jgi:hypothetical protein